MNITLYQKDSTDRIRSWQIEVVDHSNYSETIIATGLIDGGKTITYNIIREGKNVGKSNETTHYTQSVLEAESKIASKLKEGYVEDINNLKHKDVLGSGVLAPMLAHKHHLTGAQKSSKTLKQIGILGKIVYVQPKLDGNRCNIKIDTNGKAVMYARSGDAMPVQLSHILIEAERTYKDLHLTEAIELDGELFTTKFSFNKLNGLIKRQTVTKEDIEERKNIKYHLYDVMKKEGYEVRYPFIQKFASENIELIPNYEIIATDENIKKWLEKFLSEGHEGLMIRQLGMPYDHKRSWQLVKVKVFEDEEFELIGFEEDKRGNFVGSFVVTDGTHTFNAGASGQGEEERTYMWNHPEEFIGKMATICFFGRSEYGVPRFPKFKGIK
jgi:DNA ligase-1